MNDNRWTKRITDWHPYNEKQSRKRPDTRWRNEIEKFAGVAWQRLAHDSYGRNWGRPPFSSGLIMADDDNDDI